MIVDNYSYSSGGGASECSAIYNTLIARNAASASAGIFAYDVACVQLVNSTVTANTNLQTTVHEIVAKVAMTNSVVYGNTVSSGSSEVTSIKGVACSCYPTATEGENGNTARDPKLRTVGGKEYAATSARCKGKGVEFDWMTDPADVRSKDWYGDPRILGDGPDMGWVSLKKMGLILLLR